MIAALGAALALSVPDEADQRRFWNEWNAKYRGVAKVASLDDATVRRRDTILRWLGELDLNRPRILDVGCSTGWLTAQLLAYGQPMGIDLADASIREARKRFPDIPFVCGNFLRFEPPTEPFDVVVSLDVLSCVADQRAFLQRVARVLKPGGHLLLTTPNRFVLERRSDVDPQGAGQVRHWQSPREMRRLLRDDFEIRRMTTLAPGGHLGILRIVNSYRLTGVLERTPLGDAVGRVKERLGLGESIAVLAQRRQRAIGPVRAS